MVSSRFSFWQFCKSFLLAQLDTMSIAAAKVSVKTVFFILYVVLVNTRLPGHYTMTSGCKFSIMTTKSLKSWQGLANFNYKCLNLRLLKIVIAVNVYHISAIQLRRKCDVK